jgi:hypothetical protein
MNWTLVLLALLALWVLALVAALVRVFTKIHLRRPREPRDSSMDWTRRAGCLRVPDDVYRRPDPCIYSQYYLMSCGIGSSGGQRLSLGDYVTAATRGATGAGGC